MFPIERKIRPYIVGRLMKKYGRIYIHVKQTLVHIRNTGMFKDHCFFPKAVSYEFVLYITFKYEKKVKIRSDDHQFHQYQQSKQSQKGQ